MSQSDFRSWIRTLKLVCLFCLGPQQAGPHNIRTEALDQRDIWLPALPLPHAWNTSRQLKSHPLPDHFQLIQIRRLCCSRFAARLPCDCLSSRVYLGPAKSGSLHGHQDGANVMHPVASSLMYQHIQQPSHLLLLKCCILLLLLQRSHLLLLVRRYLLLLL